MIAFTEQDIAYYCQLLGLKLPETPKQLLETKRKITAYIRNEDSIYQAEMADYTNRHWQY